MSRDSAGCLVVLGAPMVIFGLGVIVWLLYMCSTNPSNAPDAAAGPYILGFGAIVALIGGGLFLWGLRGLRRSRDE